MSRSWSHEYFDQKYDDAYADWLSYVSRNFPTQEENYVVPAVWFGRAGFRSNFEEIFFPAGGGGKAAERDIPPYVAELFLDAPPQFYGEEVVPTHYPLKEWRQLVEGANSPLKNSLVEQVIVGRPVPADSVIYRGTELEIEELRSSET